MATSKENLTRKYKDMQAEYERLSGKQYKGVQELRYEAIILRLEEKFYLTPDYIEKIVRMNLNDPKQTAMEFEK